MKALIVPVETRRTLGGTASPLAGPARRLLLNMLGRLEWGRIILIDRGTRHEFGQAGDDAALVVTVTIRDPRAFAMIAFGGSIGAAEAYMLAYWDADDATALVRIVLRNQMLFRQLDSGLARLSAPLYKTWHFLRRNTPSGSRRNIVAHYDLGNDFYRLFLDETLTYSAGFFETPQSTLKDAAIAKYDRICRKLSLSSRDHVLEIGAGWGGFALHAVRHYGCRVTTTTISDEQYELARRRFEAAGIADKVTLLKADYRALQGRFDKLVSIEMIEAVGHHYLETFLEICARRLKPDGSMLIQAITMADWAFEEHKRSVDFIKRYIFPGSCIPSVTAITGAAARKTDLRLLDLEDMTPHYATTLRLWRENFMANIQGVRAMGFPETFIRMWEYYLRYCEAGFEERYLGSVQMVFARPLARIPSIERPSR